ncbi:uncharacterized protein AAES06_023149 [Glossophaga mutica]
MTVILQEQAVPGLTSKDKQESEGFAQSVWRNAHQDSEAWLLPSRQVVALTLLIAYGTVLKRSGSSNAEASQALQVHLGCLGVVLTITLQGVPQFPSQGTSFPSALREALVLRQGRAAAGLRLDYRLVYEDVMKKVVGQPHWAKA